jgi:hypothetical protein
MCPCLKLGLAAAKRHYSSLDPGPARSASVASDDISRYCVQMLRMFLNATGNAADERRADAVQAV